MRGGGGGGVMFSHTCLSWCSGSRLCLTRRWRGKNGGNPSPEDDKAGGRRRLPSDPRANSWSGCLCAGERELIRPYKEDQKAS